MGRIAMATTLAGKLAENLSIACSIVVSILTTSASFSASASQSINLAWDGSSDTTVVGYRLYYGVGSGQYTNSLAVGTNTNAVVSGLVDGATYYFAATAVGNSGLESTFSNEISYSVPTVVAA